MKKGIDLATILGVILGLVSLVGAIIMEFNELNPDLGSSFLQISALMIIFGGTTGATMLSFTMEQMMTFPKLMVIALSKNDFDPGRLINTMVRMAERARREGVLCLEEEVPQLEKTDRFLANGLRMVVDGVEPQIVEEMLHSEIGTMEERHAVGVNIFNSLGGYAPTMGIIGTVVGLISALAKAGEGGGEANAVVSAIATAFIATFYGIGSANLLFLPIASKLKVRSQHEAFYKRVAVEALKSIQSGENPRLIYAKLSVLFRRGEVPEFEMPGK